MENKKYNLGFTLLEMSITIFIAGIVIVLLGEFHFSLINSSKYNLTLDKLNIIQKSINEYILKNEHLPCPASLNKKINDIDYGIESRNDLTKKCEYDTEFYNKSNNLIYGLMPVKTLELSNEYSFDAWMNNIIYIVSKDYADSRITFLNSINNKIIIKNLNDNTSTNNAIFIILSNGKNKNGSFNNGIQHNIDNNLLDIENIYQKDFDNIFVKDIQNKKFDDIVYYSEKDKIIIELELEDTPCNLKDLYNLDENWKYTKHSTCPNNLCQQGIEIESLNTCKNNTISLNPTNNNTPIRKCLKYGRWSDVIYPCINSCSLDTLYNITDGNFYDKNNATLYLNINHLKRVVYNEITTLKCINGKTGYITLKCLKEENEEEKWIYINGECV